MKKTLTITARKMIISFILEYE